MSTFCLTIKTLTDGLREKIRKDGKRYYHGTGITSASVVMNMYSREAIPELKTRGYYLLVNYRITTTDLNQTIDILPDTKVILRLLLHVIHFIIASYAVSTWTIIMFCVSTMRPRVVVAAETIEMPFVARMLVSPGKQLF